MRLGFLVNPNAGVGGPLALRGSDAGLEPGNYAATRAIRALTSLSRDDIVLTCGGAMGEDVVQAAGLQARVVHRAVGRSRAADSIAAVAALVAEGVDLIAFAGGDGTARDVLAAAPTVPVLGIPAGVKMHSGVFATSPAAAAAMLADCARAPRIDSTEAELIDRDAHGVLHLYGMMRTVAGRRRQPAKAMGGADVGAQLAGAVAATATELAAEPLLVVGPGATMLALKAALSGGGTLLGVDVFAHGRLVARDADEATLWALTASSVPRLALGVIGGQGFLLGRGNRQISARVTARSGAAGLVVLASAAKLAALPGGRLLVDTGDPDLDACLAGHLAVRTGRRQSMLMRVDAA